MPPASWQVLATTGVLFQSFGPYVPSITDDGRVAFQAEMKDGSSCIYTSQDGRLEEAFRATSPLQELISHPDIAGDQLCIFGQLLNGPKTVQRIKSKTVETVAAGDIGPLGPTMNTRGVIAFRDHGSDGSDRICVSGVGVIASTGPRFRQFFGLPVILENDEVIFRADLENGESGLFSGTAQSIQALLDSRDVVSLGNFPSANARGNVVFAGHLRSQGEGIFSVMQGQVRQLIDASAGFASFRGALIGKHDELLFFAYLPDGRLGIFRGPDPVQDKLLLQGDPWQESSIAEFALNPVSFRHQHVAVRVKLANGRELILKTS